MALRAPVCAGETGTTGSVLFWPLGPRTQDITDYDHRNVAIYGWLLEADAWNMSEADMACVFLSRYPHISPRIALIAARAHLSRAHWLVAVKFAPLLWLLDD